MNSDDEGDADEGGVEDETEGDVMEREETEESRDEAGEGGTTARSLANRSSYSSLSLLRRLMWKRRY